MTEIRWREDRNFRGQVTHQTWICSCREISRVCFSELIINHRLCNDADKSCFVLRWRWTGILCCATCSRVNCAALSALALYAELCVVQRFSAVCTSCTAFIVQYGPMGLYSHIVEIVLYSTKFCIVQYVLYSTKVYFAQLYWTKVKCTFYSCIVQQ